MCVVIDINTLAIIFDKENKKHGEFAPVKNWIDSKLGGTIIYGGNSYKKELQKTGKYLKILRLYREAGKVTLISDNIVDTHEGRIRATLGEHTTCDDPRRALE